LEANSDRKPSFVLMDMRAEKIFQLAGMNTSLFARVFNLLDTRFAIGSVDGVRYDFVFNNTGSPDYSLNPTADRAKLSDPNRYYPPRRIEIGFTVNSQ
jgi:hypothetical protein